jgi:hypothetical protein
MSEKEIIPETGVVEKSKLYVAEKKVKTYSVAEDTTPAGGRVIDIQYDDGTKESLTEANFDAVKGYQKGDATKRQEKLVRAAGTKIYALLMEYSPKILEINHILNQTVRLSEDAADEAINEIWGVERTMDRDLLSVNRILTNQHARKQAETEAGDGPAS